MNPNPDGNKGKFSRLDEASKSKESAQIGMTSTNKILMASGTRRVVTKGKPFGIEMRSQKSANKGGVGSALSNKFGNRVKILPGEAAAKEKREKLQEIELMAYGIPNQRAQSKPQLDLVRKTSHQRNMHLTKKNTQADTSVSYSNSSRKDKVTTKRRKEKEKIVHEVLDLVSSEDELNDEDEYNCQSEMTSVTSIFPTIGDVVSNRTGTSLENNRVNSRDSKSFVSVQKIYLVKKSYNSSRISFAATIQAKVFI